MPALLLLLLCLRSDEEDLIFFILERSLVEGRRLLGRDLRLLSFL